MKILGIPSLVAIATVLLTHAVSAAEITASDDPAPRAAGNVEPGLDDMQSAPAAPQWTLGIGAAYVPRYEGSNEHRLTWLPSLPIGMGVSQLALVV